MAIDQEKVKHTLINRALFDSIQASNEKFVADVTAKYNAQLVVEGKLGVDTSLGELIQGVKLARKSIENKTSL